MKKLILVLSLLAAANVFAKSEEPSTVNNQGGSTGAAVFSPGFASCSDSCPANVAHAQLFDDTNNAAASSNSATPATGVGR